MRTGGGGRLHEPTHPGTITFVNTQHQALVALQLLRNSGFPRLYTLRVHSASLTPREVEIALGDFGRLHGLCGEESADGDGFHYVFARQYYDLTPPTVNTTSVQQFGIFVSFANVEGDIIFLNMLALGGQMPDCFQELLRDPTYVIVTWGFTEELDAIHQGTDYREEITSLIGLRNLLAHEPLAQYGTSLTTRTRDIGRDTLGALTIPVTLDGLSRRDIQVGNAAFPDLTTAIYLLFRIVIGELLYAHRSGGMEHVRPFTAYPNFSEMSTSLSLSAD